MKAWNNGKLLFQAYFLPENGRFPPTSGAVVYPGRTGYDGFTNRKEPV